MSVVAQGYCQGCGARFARIGARTGDEHSASCTAPVIIERAWSAPGRRVMPRVASTGRYDDSERCHAVHPWTVHS